ncbi:hypothetical protein FOA52_014080 [Chlamydomonas sp. UWO 241]|nr:hypothetical protein FOA52_014080 [Chlamydomonas sp. UWO 241]
MGLPFPADQQSKLREFSTAAAAFLRDADAPSTTSTAPTFGGLGMATGVDAAAAATGGVPGVGGVGGVDLPHLPPALVAQQARLLEMLGGRAQGALQDHFWSGDGLPNSPFSARGESFMATLYTEFKHVKTVIKDRLALTPSATMLNLWRFIARSSDSLMVPNIILLMNVYYVMALHTAEVERGFSIHRILKNRLRSRLMILMVDSLLRIWHLAQSFTGPRESENNSLINEAAEKLSGASLQSQGPEAHYDDAGPIIDEGSERWRRAQTRGSTAAADATAAAAVQAQAGGAGVAASLRQQLQELQRTILEGIAASSSGMDANMRGSEAMERELEGVLELLGAGAGAPAPTRPPASRKLVASLPVISTTREQLDAWGDGAVCAVCTCELEVGERVQVLPCNHRYHPACVAPWFAANNSCPTCRQELPTDDAKYEARKEREAEEAEERMGAANAVRENYMYM